MYFLDYFSFQGQISNSNVIQIFLSKKTLINLGPNGITSVVGATFFIWFEVLSSSGTGLSDHNCQINFKMTFFMSSCGPTVQGKLEKSVQQTIC